MLLSKRMKVKMFDSPHTTPHTGHGKKARNSET